MNKLENFLDEDGRITSWPSRQENKKAVLSYLADRFDNGRFYTEKEVNALIGRWHTFGDYFLLRRGLIDHRLLVRTRNGARYWKDDPADTSETD